MDDRLTISLLNLCARIDKHPETDRRLLHLLARYTQWDDLLHKAERQGMAPLLYRHLSSLPWTFPDVFIRRLRFLTLHHKQANAMLLQSLQGILETLQQHDIPVLVLKGAALCNTLYPEPGLRPMRDIDLLLPPEHIHHAQELLQKTGLCLSRSIVPEDHFHLTPLYQKVNGYSICVELHHGLFPNCPPYTEMPPFDVLYERAFAFKFNNGQVAATLAHEDMLWHLYEHGFHPPLTYEPYKIVTVADIISLVEKYNKYLDWDRIRSVYPHLMRALPLLHFISPWNKEMKNQLWKTRKKIPSGAGVRFQGWPQRRLAVQKQKSIWTIFSTTFIPSQWWILIYYCPVGWFGYVRCRFIQHPLHVFWWVQLYWAIFRKQCQVQQADGSVTWRTWPGLAAVMNVCCLIREMYNKIR